MDPGAQTTPRLPRAIWALGAVSFCMDLSSELVHSLLPLFLVGVLGASPLAFGLIEGAAEGLVMLVRLFSGALSDRIRRRKPLALLGYGLAAAVKPLFPLADAVVTVVTARLLDRVGKGIRGAPRDALVADLAPSAVRGAAYGLRQALDSAGAVVGPVLAFALMAMLAGDVRAVMWAAVPPALLAVAVLALAVHEPPSAPARTPAPRLDRRLVAALGGDYWRVVAVGGAFTLARFSEGFLLLRAGEVGVTVRDVPLVLAAMSGTYALSAYPAGRLSDRVGRAGMLAAGAGVLAVTDLVIAFAGGPLAVFAGATLWGLHLGLTQGLLSALVADAAPGSLRGTAFGVFGLVLGVALFLASAVAGWLWVGIGPEATFLAGAGLALTTVAGCAFLPPPRSPAALS